MRQQKAGVQLCSVTHELHLLRLDCLACESPSGAEPDRTSVGAEVFLNSIGIKN